jgi:hypothetical protein
MVTSPFSKYLVAGLRLQSPQSRCRNTPIERDRATGHRTSGLKAVASPPRSLSYRQRVVTPASNCWDTARSHRGERGNRVADLPTGTVTFLFTDLEGSTRRWEDDRDAMRAAVARHDELLDDAITGNGGVVFSRMGDGVAAAFGPRSTLRSRWRPSRGVRPGRCGPGWGYTRVRAPWSGISTTVIR